MRRWLLSAALILCATQARAEVVRFRYIPIDPCGNTRMIPTGPNGAIGERQVWLGSTREPFHTTFRPTHMVTYRHPATGANVIVPLTLPESTPNVEHVFDRIIHNYGSYTVSTIFLPDGSVEVMYNSGALRPLRLQ